MAYTANTPLAANVIATDITNMRNNNAYFKSVLSNFVGAWSDSTETGIFPARIKRTAVTGTIGMAAGDSWVEIDPGAATTYTLLAAATAGAGYCVTIKAVDLDNGITIARAGADTIEPGATTSYVMFASGQIVSLMSDGTSKWYIVNEYLPVVWDVVGGNSAEDTDEHDILTHTFPIGSLRVNDLLLVSSVFSATGTAGAKTVKLYIGGTSTTVYTSTAAAPSCYLNATCQVTSATTQQGNVSSINNNATYLAPVVSLPTSAVNITTTAYVIKMSAETDNTGDEITINNLIVKVLRG